MHPRAGRLQDCHFLNLPLGDSLLHGLSLWLLSESVGQFAHWRRMRRGLGLVVRLPDAAFARLPVGDMLFRLLASHDLPTSALTIELGPRALLEHNDATLGQLATLRGNGVRIALAEVGSAMGSPALRLDSPFDEIRLDPALVARAVVSQRVKDGMCLMYHAQEKIVNVPGSELTGQRGGIHNSVTRAVLKPTHMIGGYAQQSYGFNYYGTIGTNRDEFVIVRKMEKVDWLEGPAVAAKEAAE